MRHPYLYFTSKTLRLTNYIHTNTRLKTLVKRTKTTLQTNTFSRIEAFLGFTNPSTLSVEHTHTHTNLPVSNLKTDLVFNKFHCFLIIYYKLQIPIGNYRWDTSMYFFVFCSYSTTRIH